MLPGKPLALIADPCVMESEAHVRFLAGKIRGIAGPDFVFKASFDKANRSSGAAFRGPGIREGMRILEALKADGYRVLTDIHEPWQADIAAARTGRIVNSKKGQFVSPWDIRHAANKVAATGNPNIFLTERGTSFGYNNLVVDRRSLAIMRIVTFGEHTRALFSRAPKGSGRVVDGGRGGRRRLMGRCWRHTLRVKCCRRADGTRR